MLFLNYFTLFPDLTTQIIQITMADIDWESINAKLPFQRTDEEKAKRRELFKQFDPNGNGYLSLAEVSKTKFIICPSFEILFMSSWSEIFTLNA